MTRPQSRRSFRFLALTSTLMLLTVAGPLRAQPEDWADDESKPNAEDNSSAEPEPPAPEPEAPLPRAYIAPGIGLTQRTIRFNAFDGRRQLDTGWLPALALSLRAGIEENFFWHVELSYRSSVFASAVEMPPLQGGPELRTMIQTHSFVGGVEPGLHFSGPNSATLALFVGYRVHALGSVRELSIPRFSLHGPWLRLTLELPLLAARLALRFSPELMAIVSQTHDLRELARTAGWGLSYGAEIRLCLQIVSAVSAQLSYRQAHAHISSGWPAAFTDVERQLLLEAVARYF